MQVSLPYPTAPNVGGVPQTHNFFHPHFSNHATELAISETFNIGVKPLASITGSRITPGGPRDVVYSYEIARARADSAISGSSVPSSPKSRKSSKRRQTRFGYVGRFGIPAS